MPKFTYNKRLIVPNLVQVSLMIAISITVLFSIHQTSWAAVVNCPATLFCNGTSGDDMIFGFGNNQIIHGLEGNDFILAYVSSNVYGDDGDDILLGSSSNDYLDGGRGNDRYYGGAGSDTIWESYVVEGSLVNNKDVISGGEGDDYIGSGYDADRIASGPGNDTILPNGHYRDFSFDNVNCGAGGDAIQIFSNDGDTATNCETITDFDR